MWSHATSSRGRGGKLAWSGMERFGPFTLLQRIGAGGMCEVFRARRDGAAGDVALKRLHEEMEQRPDVLDLFLTEADVAVLLHHPNLVDTYESGEVAGHYFITMELVDGLDLGRAQRLGPARGVIVDVPLALHIAAEICRGLAYLHAARSPAGRAFGLVHRDVSPENVFLTRAGEVKVADFGLAKLGALETVTSLYGTVKGKLSYMSPEQMRGDGVDARTDLFAAALILYELVTGHRPYARREEESEAAHALRIRDAVFPRARKLEPTLPRALDRALRRALQRKPKKRFADCSAFAAALDKICQHDLELRGSQHVAELVAALLSPPGTAAAP